jgi:hypothetical protein
LPKELPRERTLQEDQEEWHQFEVKHLVCGKGKPRSKSHRDDLHNMEPAKINPNIIDVFADIPFLWGYCTSWSVNSSFVGTRRVRTGRRRCNCERIAISQRTAYDPKIDTVIAAVSNNPGSALFDKR